MTETGTADRAAWARLAKTAKAAGVPREVLELFVAVGYVPQPRQLVFHGLACSLDEWQPDRTRPTTIGFGGARGGGKTHALIAQVCADCVRYPELRALILRRTGAALVETIEAFAPMLHGFGARPTRGGYRFANGARLTIAHFRNPADVDRHLGQSRDVIGIEEATTLTASKFRALQTTVRGARSDFRPRTYLTTNPGGVGHAWYRDWLVRGQPPASDRGVYRHIQATIDDNPIARRLDPAYVAILDSLTGWELRAYRYGDWDIAAGAFFPTLPRTEPMPPSGSRVLVVFGLDYGWTHPTAVYRIVYDYDAATAYVTDEYHAARRSVDEIAAWIKARGGTEVYAGSDVHASGEGLSVADRFRRAGVFVRRANQDRLAGAALIAEWIRDDRLVVDPSCRALLEQLARLEADPDRPGDVMKVNADPQTGQGGDDAYDALRYGLMAVADRVDGRGLRASSRGGMVDLGPSTLAGGLR